MDWIEGTDLARLLRVQRPPRAGAVERAALAGRRGGRADPPAHPGPAGRARRRQARQPRPHHRRRASCSSTSAGRPRRTPHADAAARVGYAAPELAAGRGAVASQRRLLAGRHCVRAAHRRAADGHPPTVGAASTRARPSSSRQRSARAGDRPGAPAGDAGELVERLRAGWGSTLPTGVLTFCLTDIEGSTAAVGGRPGRHGAGAGAPRRARGRRRWSATAAASSSRWARATRPSRCSPSRSTRSRPRSSCSSGSPPSDCARRPPAPRPRRAAHRRGRAARRRLLRRHAEPRRPGARPGGRRSGLRSSARPPSLVARASAGRHARWSTSVRTGCAASATPRPCSRCPRRASTRRRRRRSARIPGCPRSSARTPSGSSVARTWSPNSSSGCDADRFVALVGASGSGKSSVLRAGCRPTWGGATVVTPGAAPEPVPDGPDLLVVDQLEEAFTLCDDADRRARVPRLARRTVAARSPSGCAPTSTVAAPSTRRSRRALAAQPVLLGPMTDDELREAITGPAAVGRLRIEPALVDVLVGEVSGEPGALPLLVARAAGDVGAARRPHPHPRRLPRDGRRARGHRHDRRAGLRVARPERSRTWPGGRSSP